MNLSFEDTNKIASALGANCCHQGADVHLFLAQFALEDGDERAAREHALKAHQLATCDGPPDYTYKVAYEEAEALLAKATR